LEIAEAAQILEIFCNGSFHLENVLVVVARSLERKRRGKKREKALTARKIGGFPTVTNVEA